jgi:hypothetical protein
MVETFRSSRADVSLADMADGPAVEVVGLRRGEADTMRAVAQGLLTFGRDHALEDEDEICETWAEWVAPLALAPRLDPYVGAVRGIGPALFTYLRMLSGCDALKPDRQARAALNRLGFNVPQGDVALMMIATAAAEAIGTPLLALDQLLWFSTQS